MSDAVSRFLHSWTRLRPDLDLSTVAAMGRVLRLAALMNNITEDGLAGAEVTRPEFEVLAALRRSPDGLRPRQLTRETIASGASTTKRLTRLESAGLITRTPLERDRREVQVRLTDRGRTLADTLFAAQLDREATVLAPLSTDEQAQLADLLARVLAPIDRA
ncbi:MULTISPECIES: MarR family winged helix-turn-helix transcriptional regulator [Nocardiopsidaceae]|uniref:MarR family transcriptional regulator n=1 Tax=Streptomonospora nanhaiensis TaxID=1323731 RepID=A0ABY6YVM8_9ACTN|nr:MarR family transcriptional regulator [Streptomonospora nanhaiensis]WAE76411.1 MarR family transcriptional regulator [Streptomonospora nanhaiensis]